MTQDLSHKKLTPLSDVAERINHQNRIDVLNMFREHGIAAKTACPLTNSLLDIMKAEKERQQSRKLQNDPFKPAA